MGAGVILRDVTLREGPDVPGVSLSVEQKVEIAEGLAMAGVPEAEVVAPDRVLDDLQFVGSLIKRGVRIRTSGLIHAASATAMDEMAAAAELLDRFDLLMSLAEQQPPHGGSQKVTTLLRVLEGSRSLSAEVGVGFPYAIQASPLFLLEITRLAVKAGASRVTFYDTNGSAEPFALQALLGELVAEIKVPVFFHGYNDLGLALANSWAAVLAGVRGLGVSSTGLGNRAGNTCLEQVAALLEKKKIPTGVLLVELRNLAQLVARHSGVALSRLAPIVGEHVPQH
jgi:homocitrate synthase NifV